jgi:acetoacetyl-CoA synthetase
VTITANSEPLWRLDDNKKRKTELWKYAESTSSFHHSLPDDYTALHLWSIEKPEEFYSSLWDFLGIVGDKGNEAYEANEDIKQVKFFPDARLNYAENLLLDADDQLAIIAHRDDGSRRTLSRKQLYDQVSRMVKALQKAGIGERDCVAALVTNDIEAIISYLATAAIGAVWSSCSPDFGPVAASDRLCQIFPKMLIAVSSYSYAGKAFDTRQTIRAIAETCNLDRIILLDENQSADLNDLPVISYTDFLAPFQPANIEFKRLPFDAPLAILFSSGTTGQPKCIVHSAMGLLLQHKKELKLHCDFKDHERFFYFTTCGWMMWNWQLSGLALRATLVTYDGNPFYPKPNRLLDLIDQEEISVFGTSAKYIDACQNFGLSPKKSHKLKSLKLILSTGSPLIPSSFDYIYQAWKGDVHLASISGGTDICACFLGGNSLLPVRRGELQCRMLGMDVDVLDPEGKPLTGEPGELVCRNAHLSMPLGFWGDEDAFRYHQSYFVRFPGLWTHGDYVEKCHSGGYIIHGRSDTTLNPGGVRIGTSEIYRQVESIPDVEESIAVGQDWQGDQRIILFVKLRVGAVLDESLVARIKQQVRSGATPRHVPAKIVEIAAIPRTRSGKISEVAVRDIIHGRTIQNLGAIENPECLDFYKNLDTLNR